MRHRPFRFGINLAGIAETAAWSAQARRAEDLGYSVITMSDHFAAPLSTVPALMAAAAATRSIRIGSLVFNNDLRHPIVLAEEMATLDVLSGGRLELGLGAGWMQSDYARAGFAFDRASVRVQRLAEAITILKGLWSNETYSFSGRHYQVREMKTRPKPLQHPHPPLLLGGGRHTILSLAASEADIVAVHIDFGNGERRRLGADATTAATLEKLDWVRVAAGARFEALELQMCLFGVAVTDVDSASREAVQHYGLSQEDVLQSPHFALGSVEQIIEVLRERRERFGVSYLTVLGQANGDIFAPIVARLAGT